MWLEVWVVNITSFKLSALWSKRLNNETTKYKISCEKLEMQNVKNAKFVFFVCFLNYGNKHDLIWFVKSLQNLHITNHKCLKVCSGACVVQEHFLSYLWTMICSFIMKTEVWLSSSYRNWKVQTGCTKFPRFMYYHRYYRRTNVYGIISIAPKS